ncbi:uncharacterized protein LOC143210611 [Lasioglossum baleicum]|uniref:uncharacterized protein LOC143210611 n=1 Tax=Lasioglossum baleicum TaxID=434251 RepID=UPI003FCEDDC1
MLSRTSLLVLIYHVLTSLTAPATYDQRQTGNLNVQVHLKDLQIIALINEEMLDDYTEYDYFYTDYGTNNGKPEDEESLNSTESLPPSSESAVSNSTVEDSNEFSVLNSTVEDLSESSVLNSTVEDSSESLVLNSTVEDSSESSVLNSTVEDSSEASVLNSTVKDSSEPSVLNSTVEDSSEFSVLNSTVEDSSESSVLNSTVEDSSKTSTANTEGSTEATIEKTEKSISENINIRNTSVEPEEQQLGLSPQRNRTRLTRKRCRSGCPADGKGHCCRMSNRRLSLVPLAMELAPKILDSLLVRSVKRQPS